MFLVRPPLIVTRLFSSILWKVPVKTKTLYLTFDDGPIPQTTPWVLGTLKQFNAKATFFCIGDNVRKYPDLYDRLVEEGHSVGNHTFNHLNGWKTDNSQYYENVEKAGKIIQTKLFRPPYGKIRTSQKDTIQQDHRIVMWDVLSRDYDQKISPQTCLNNVLNFARPGSIIVFHDSLKAQANMSFALPRMLEHFSEQGYRFKAIGEEEIARKQNSKKLIESLAKTA